MDQPGRVSSRLISKRAALCTLNNNAAAPESDSSTSRPFKKPRNTSRVPSKRFLQTDAQQTEEEQRDSRNSGAPGKQQESEKPPEVPAKEQGVDKRPAHAKQPGSKADTEQGAAEELPPAGDGEGVNGGVGPGANEGAGAEEKGDASRRAEGEACLRTTEPSKGTNANAPAQESNLKQSEAGDEAEVPEQGADVNVAREDVNVEAREEATNAGAEKRADNGARPQSPDEASGEGAKDKVPQQQDTGAGDNADVGLRNGETLPRQSETHGQATNAGGASQADRGSAQQEAGVGVPGRTPSQPGPGRCTYTRCTYVRGQEGEVPDESRREGASKACRDCGACLHNLCCQEISGVEADFICEDCHKGAQHGGSTAPAKGGRCRKSVKRKGTNTSKDGRAPHQRTGLTRATPAAATQPTAATAANPGREGRNGGRLGVVACPKCNVEQASGRKFCQDLSCKAPIREARAAAKRAVEREAMKAAEEADGFSMTSASKSVHEFAKKRLFIASGGRAEGVLMLAHRNEDGEKRFKFYGMGEAATVFAKNSTLQGSFKTHMERSYKKEDEARKSAARAEEGPSPSDIEVSNFLEGLGTDYTEYAAKFRTEGFTMATLKLAKDDNLAALGIRMGPRIRIMAAASTYQITEPVQRQKTPAKSGGTLSAESPNEKDVDSEDESDAGVL